MSQGKHSPAIIILLGDGESNVGCDPIEAAAVAARHGVHTYTIGIGTAVGDVLHIQGQSVHVRVDEAPLKQIAEQADGYNFNATGAQSLLSVYAKVGARTVLRKERTEVTFPFAGAAIALAAVARFFSLPWFNRLP